MSEPKPGFLERIVQTFSHKFLFEIVRRVAKKLMVMVAGVIITLMGSLFLFVALAKYLNEILRSTWMGWGIGGLVTLIVGLVIYGLGRR